MDTIGTDGLSSAVMAILQIPVMAGPSPARSIDVDAYEGGIHLDLRAVTEDGTIELTTNEARAVAAVLVHQAGEIESGRS